MLSEPLRAGLEKAETRKQVDPGGSAGAEWIGAPRRPGPGQAQEQQAGALPSVATRGHWLPLLELQAPLPPGLFLVFQSQHSPRHLLSLLGPGANTNWGVGGGGRGLLTEHPPPSLPGEARSQPLGSGPQLLLPGSLF